MKRSEKALWRKWVERRDGDAFAALVRRHAAFAYDFARRVAGNAADAEDLAQEAYLELAEAEAETPRRVGIRAFLGRRIVLAGKMLKRAALTRSRHEQAVPAGEPPRSPEEKLERQELAQKALSLLDGEERRSVELRFLHDLSYAEIAHVLDTSEEAARMRVHRALARLRARLGKSAPAILAALPRFSPPAHLVAATSRTALLTGGLAMAQVSSKKLVLVTLLLLGTALTGGAVLHYAGSASKHAAPRPTPRLSALRPPDVGERAQPAPATAAEAHRIQGAVFDETGAPIRGAIIRLVDEFGIVRDHSIARSGTDGTFETSLFAAATLDVRREGYARATAQAKVGEAVRVVLRRSCAVRVEVYGEGLPVSGARVVLSNGSEFNWLGMPGVLGPCEGKTGDSGTVDLAVSPGRYRVWVRSPDWAPFFSDPVPVETGKERPTVRVDLHKGGILSGTVLNPDGDPAAGARIVVQAARYFYWQVRTGPDGTFSVAQVPISDPFGATVVAEGSGYAPAQAIAHKVRGETDRLEADLVLGRGATLVGDLRDANGNPVPGAKLSVTPRGSYYLLYGCSSSFDPSTWPYAEETDESGDFRIERLPAGGASIDVKGCPAATTSVILKEGELLGPVHLRTGTSSSIRGRVLDGAGRPVPHAHVELIEGLNIRDLGVTTDSSGRFVLPRQSHSFTLAVEAAGYAPLQRENISPDSGEIVLRFPAGALRGRVVRLDGSGVAGAFVQLGTVVNGMSFSGGRCAVCTQDDGSFQFEGAGDRVYRFRLFAKGLALPGPWRTVKGRKDDLLFTLVPKEKAANYMVRGRAFDAATGTPVRATVYYGTSGQSAFTNAEGRADEPGDFLCPMLEPEGDMQLTFRAEGYMETDPVAVRYDGKSLVPPLTLRLHRGATVAVTVERTDGTPVADAWVFCQSQGILDARTDGNGRALLAGLRPGRVTLQAGGDYLTGNHEQTVDLEDGTTTNVEFRLRACGLVCVRLPDRFRPKEALEVQLVDSKGKTVSEGRFRAAQIDAIARYSATDLWSPRLPGVPAGTYTLRCTIDGTALPEKELTVKLRQTTEVTLGDGG